MNRFKAYAIIWGEFEPARSTQIALTETKIGGVRVELTLKHVISVSLTTGETTARKVRLRAELFDFDNKAASFEVLVY